ncbi:MAG: acyl-homoserine-lactone synthase [Pseudomonadota bacterium]
MFEQRTKVFVDWLGWTGLTVVDGQERDEIDDVPQIEYVLTINEFGELLGSSRFVPSLGRHLLAGPLKDYVQRPYECGPQCWEWTRYAPTTAPDTPNARSARAFMLTAVQEWALSRGVTHLLGISDDSNIAFASRMGWKSTPLGLPRSYSDAGAATAVVFEATQQSLADTRAFWKMTQAVTYQAPPPMTEQPITCEEIGILDAMMGLCVEERPAVLDMLSHLDEVEERRFGA